MQIVIANGVKQSPRRIASPFLDCSVAGFGLA